MTVGSCAPGAKSRTSVTAGTIFDRTRTPLTVWFTACWLFVTGKDGNSALSLKRTLEIGSYQTAWTMLHRLRAVLVRSSAPAHVLRQKPCRLSRYLVSWEAAITAIIAQTGDPGLESESEVWNGRQLALDKET